MLERLDASLDGNIDEYARVVDAAKKHFFSYKPMTEEEKEWANEVAARLRGPLLSLIRGP